MEFTALAEGADLGRLTLEVSEAANDRYWDGAGVEHPARQAGLLYPPMAANFAILLFQGTVPDAVLHTRHDLRCHAAASAPAEVVVTGGVEGRFEKRGRPYVRVHTTVATAGGQVLWSSWADFTPTAARPARPAPAGGQPAPTSFPLTPPAPGATTRRLTLDAQRLRRYSRAGNFHSDPDEARRLGLPGLVAQGMQVAGPAYGVLLDAWGEAFVEQGSFEARFVGMVTEDQTVEARVVLDAGDAAFEVVNLDARRPAAVGAARLAPRSS